MGRILRMFFAALIVSLPLAGCGSQGATLPALEPSPAAELDYSLGPGDKVSIKVLDSEDITGNYTVGDNGTVSIPLIGELKAAGLSRAELEQEIARKLAQGYITNPKVSVAILTYRPFFVLGEVAKPGGYPYVSGMRVLNAVALAGGYTYRANENYAIVTRHGEDRKATSMAPIQPDDIIRVPERFF